MLPVFALGTASHFLKPGVPHIATSANPQRLRDNQAFYDRAIAGDVSALQALLDRSPVEQGGGGHLATAVAQADAFAKYQQAVRLLRANQTPGVSAPIIPTHPSSVEQLAATPGAAPPAPPSKPGLLAQVLDAFGLGATRQEHLATTAGQAAGAEAAAAIRQGIVLMVLVVAGVAGLLLLVRRR